MDERIDKMKDITVYSDDRIFSSLLVSELKKIGKSVGTSTESCILLIIDADSKDQDIRSEAPHTFTLGISRDPEKYAESFDATVKRPVSMKELRKTVSDLLDRKNIRCSVSSPDKDEIILLTDRKTVLFNGEKIPLTPNEFSLLEYLMENRGRPVSRDTINELLKGDGNTSDVYICMLRKKLTFNRRSPIVTVRGKGYMIE